MKKKELVLVDGVVYAKIKGHIYPNKKDEDTEKGRRWRNLTQTESTSLWQELCREIEEDVLETYGVSEGKQEGIKAEVMSRSG